MNKHLLKIHSATENLIDNKNILRCRSRLAEAKRLDFDSKNPMLLRNCSRFPELTVSKFHQDLYHNGVETTLCK